MMTGNFPQKANIVTAFGALSSKEDSIPHQLSLENKTPYFSGDPVLLNYFPQHLISETHVEAFDIRNDHVDDVTHHYIKKKIRNKDFDFLLAHLLRIDHMGHAYGLTSQAIPDAIADVDKLIIEIITMIDDDTMLIFGGDHGMTVGGNHGGDSLQETNMAIVAYYKRGLMKCKHKNEEIKKVMRSVNDANNQILQADLVPTLSMLLGIPIPFSTMGQILNDLYPVGSIDEENHHQNCPDSNFEVQMLNDNHLNTLQS